VEKIVPGLVGEWTITIEKEHTALHLGSGNVYVLATPMMIRLMEGASVKAVDDLLPEGQRTVGVHIDVQHLAPTPMGMVATGRAELVEVDGRKLTFRVEAFDEKEKIGEGIHHRVIIDVERFQKRIEEKARVVG